MVNIQKQQLFFNNFSEDAINVLIYNSTGDRNFEMMLQTLHSGKFHKVFFTTNTQKAPTKDNNGELY